MPKHKKKHAAPPKPKSFLERIPLWVAYFPLVLAAAAIAIVLLYKQELRAALRRAALAPPPAPEVLPPEPEAPRIAIVIDDLGYTLPPIERLLAIRAPLTFAVMPGRPYSTQAAALVVREGRELILHQPMEPLPHRSNGNGYGGEPASEVPDPGPGAVFLSMSEEEITRQVAANLEAFPAVVGMNNHMGSAFTRDAGQMRAALVPLLSRGLYFLDSKTAPDSVAQDTARQAGLRAIGRDVFLDHEINEEFISRQFAELVRIAKIRGSAIAIGHPHPETVSVLEREIPKLAADGIRLVPAGVFAREASLEDGGVEQGVIKNGEPEVSRTLP
ncbi:MAG: divergent polysaccharide deacetylase family protein [Bdellovibrionota bacterium]